MTLFALWICDWRFGNLFLIIENISKFNFQSLDWYNRRVCLEIMWIESSNIFHFSYFFIFLGTYKLVWYSWISKSLRNKIVPSMVDSNFSILHYKNQSHTQFNHLPYAVSIKRSSISKDILLWTIFSSFRNKKVEDFASNLTSFCASQRIKCRCVFVMRSYFQKWSILLEIIFGNLMKNLFSKLDKSKSTVTDLSFMTV